MLQVATDLPKSQTRGSQNAARNGRNYLKLRFNLCSVVGLKVFFESLRR
jgi:hypothetical protein